MPDLKAAPKHQDPELTLEAKKAVRDYIVYIATRCLAVLAVLSGVSGYLVKELIEKSVTADIKKDVQPSLDKLRDQMFATQGDIGKYKLAMDNAKIEIETFRKNAITAQLEVEKYKMEIADAKALIEKSRDDALKVMNTVKISRDQSESAKAASQSLMVDMGKKMAELKQLGQVYKDLGNFTEIQDVVINALSKDVELKRSIATIASQQNDANVKKLADSTATQVQESIKQLETKFYAKAEYPALAVFGKAQEFVENKGTLQESKAYYMPNTLILQNLKLLGSATHAK